MRSSLACGMIGALALGAAGLLAYGWRGGLAGATIGATVGLDCFERIDTFRLKAERRRRNQTPSRSSTYDTFYWAFYWVWVRRGVAELVDLDYPGALQVAAGAAVLAGVLLGWSDGAANGLTYDAATAVAVLTAVSLCIGYGYAVMNLSAVTPRERSYEVSSPVARSVARGGLLATPVVALATPILPGLLVAWPGTAADGVRFAAVVAVGAAIISLV